MKEIKISSNKSFGIVFFFFFFIVSILPLFNGGNFRVWSAILSIIFLILGLMNSNILSPLNKIWFKVGMILGNIVSPIVMGIIFFFVVTPTSLIMRAFGKDLLSLKKSDKKSYWVERTNIKSMMKNQF